MTAQVAVVVEDDLPFASRIAEAVASLDDPWTVHTFHCGRDAIAALGRSLARVDLVLADLGLPDVSGLEVIRAARKRFPRAPVVVVSVLDGADTVLEAIRLGARGYVHKGSSGLSLAEALRSVLAGHCPISPSLAQYLFRQVRSNAPGGPVEAGALAAREVELLRLLSLGYSYQEAAQQMGVRLSTVQNYAKRIYRKLEVNTKRQALTVARELGIVV